MKESLFRKKSMERISSPEQLNDYLHVTNPTVWLVLAAVILLLAGMLIWSSVARIDSFAAGTAQVDSGIMTVYFEDSQLAKHVEPGMTVSVGEVETTISSVGMAENGTLFAVANTTLADGSYSARVSYTQTQVLRLLFN